MSGFLAVIIFISPLIISPPILYSQDKLKIIPRKSVNTSNLSVLVVLMELIDDPHHPTHTAEYFYNLFFSDEGSSIKQYFFNNSYGTISLNGDVLGWFQSEHDLSYYGSGTRISPGTDSAPDTLVYEARNHAINYEKNPVNYDQFVVIHSGDGQEYSGNSNDIWSHKFDLRNFGLSSVGYTINHEYINYETPSHELGHAIYFPDLYDWRYFQHEFAGPYAMMDSGDGHFSIWNKYYTHVSRNDSPEFLSDQHRLQILNYSTDTLVTINPIAMQEPNGTMWLEIGWNSTGFSDSKYGRGWTVTVRENLDFDKLLPNFGLVIAEIQVGPRTTDIQVSSEVYPPWNVIDAHPETTENKDDAVFSLMDGEIGTYSSGKGWAVQLIERYSNLSYRVRVTNETNIPKVNITPPNQSVSGITELFITTQTFNKSISLVEVSIDNGLWTPINPIQGFSDIYSFVWDTTAEREGSHIVRARAYDDSEIPYIGYSSYIFIDVDNNNGSILVVDDDLGRSSESYILSALDELGLRNEYEIKKTSSFIDAEVFATEMRNYKYIIWAGNPEITPLSNSHINYNEFLQIKSYLLNSNDSIQPRMLFMSSYTIFDFSNQGEAIHFETSQIFKARSPHDFRAPVFQLQGSDFLSELPTFSLGSQETLQDTRRSDGEIVSLLSGAVSILEDLNPEFPGFSSKGYFVEENNYKIVNYLFQPEMVPSSILPQLLNLTFIFLSQPVNSSLSTSSGTTNPFEFPDFELGSVIVLFSLSVAVGLGMYLVYRRFKIKKKPSESYWLKKK